jgi:hypothetical protein
MYRSIPTTIFCIQSNKRLYAMDGYRLLTNEEIDIFE